MPTLSPGAAGRKGLNVLGVQGGNPRASSPRPLVGGASISHTVAYRQAELRRGAFAQTGQMALEQTTSLAFL